MYISYAYYCFCVVFGFAQTAFVGSERGQDYQIQAGFISGRPNTGLVAAITLVDEDAGIAIYS